MSHRWKCDSITAGVKEIEEMECVFEAAVSLVKTAKKVRMAHWCCHKYLYLFVMYICTRCRLLKCN